MGDGGIKAAGRVTGLDKWLMRKFLQSIGSPPLRVVLWDGSEIMPPGASAPVGMRLRDRSTLLRLVTRPFLNFGDDYSAGRIEIEGGLVAFLEVIYRAMADQRQSRSRLDKAAHRRNQPRRNNLKEARLNIHHHYDIGNEFYRLWLDREMLYTCAYFAELDASLEEAQIAKMELVCRKLRLQAGQQVVEAGCGWGGLARHMARHHGVKVRAFNISAEQIAYARERAKAEGLAGQLEYVEDDYRNIAGKYDAFVSIGMLEHVSPDHYRELGQVIDRCLSANGLGLLHTIGQNLAQPMGPWLLKRIFPGSYPPTLREMMAIFEPFCFSVLDVENLRLHYAKTLDHWLERFESNRERVGMMFDAAFVRAWRLYLSGSIANFRVGNLQLFQVVFARPNNNQVPWTRDHLTLPAGEC